MSDTFTAEDMPILELDLSSTKRFEASRFLNSPETIAAFLAEAMKANDAQTLMHALGEVAQAKGVNRESLYKTLKGGDKTRFTTIQKLMLALGVELTVRPLKKLPASS